MSNALITTDIKHPSGLRCMEITSGKISAALSFWSSGGVQIVCLNAANRVWRGCGKRYETLAEALASYKSADMKTIIHAAMDAVAPALPANVIPVNFNA